MKISKEGLDIIKKYESCHLRAYKCPAGVWTIGYGHTRNVKQGDVITQIQADTFLIEDVASAEKNVCSFHSKYNWTQNEFDALVSFAFNVGSINQLTANGTRSKQVIAEKMLLYNKGGGVVLKGLVRRRKEEQTLFKKASRSEFPTLRKGSKGYYVGYLQEKLNSFGYNCGKVDKIFGSKTLAAVKAFQKAQNLVVDGVVGPKTWAKLG